MALDAEEWIYNHKHLQRLIYRNIMKLYKFFLKLPISASSFYFIKIHIYDICKHQRKLELNKISKVFYKVGSNGELNNFNKFSYCIFYRIKCKFTRDTYDLLDTNRITDSIIIYDFNYLKPDLSFKRTFNVTINKL